MSQRFPDEHERAAAGLDFDTSALFENASEWGSRMMENGPEALLDEIEQMLPDQWREQIQTFPIVALTLGFGVGLYLGMRKSHEVIAAGTSLVSAAAMANVNQVMDKVKGGSR